MAQPRHAWRRGQGGIVSTKNLPKGSCISPIRLRLRLRLGEDHHNGFVVVNSSRYKTIDMNV